MQPVATASGRRSWRAAPALAVAVALSAPLLSGCGFHSVQSPDGCTRDDQCATGYACSNGTCIQGGVPHGTWAIEVAPTSDSMAATTELPAVTFSQDVTVLVADAKVTVTGRMAAGSAFQGGSHVVATVQPAIPGRADLVFETDWSADNGTVPLPDFSLTVPQGAIGRAAAIRILPLPPRDVAQPPASLNVTLAPTLDLTANSNFWFVTGRLLSATRGGQTGFVARAFEAAQLISNVDPLSGTDNGQFRLAIPSLDGSPGSPSHTITIELAPADASYALPTFTTSAITVNGNLAIGDISLPAYGSANYFRFTVTDARGQPVSGAVVRVRTLTSQDASGSSAFGRDGATDANGRVDLALLPGTSAAARPYDVTVIPPPGTPFGVACLNALAIATGTTSLDPSAGDPPAAAWLVLPPKAPLSGTILSADGTVVAGVTITATRTDPGSATCADAIGSPPASASSGSDGAYRLMVDPGVYRVDYVPPAGAPVPRLTETDVEVTAEGSLGRLVQMLTGALIKGVVQGPDGAPLPYAGVKFFDVVCNGSASCYGPNRLAPLLRAETHTDADGNFRAVIPVQQ
jgi:hypothetical protein